MTKFYDFDQNNSGGSFITNDKLCWKLFIEAETYDEAVNKAEELGCYWDGVEEGIDCSCCGDRWYKPYGAISFPYKFGKNLSFENIHSYAQYLANEYGFWTSPSVRIYYLDGTVEEIFSNPKK